MAKQSRQDRLKRLYEMRCPIHGIYLAQIALEWIDLPCGHSSARRSIAHCPRKDCHILVYEGYDDNLPEIFPEFSYLLA